MDAKNIRMDVHKIPELGRCEFKTKEYILNFAKKLNCKIYEVSLTGVILYFDVKKNSQRSSIGSEVNTESEKILESAK